MKMKKYKTDLERIDAAWNKLEPLLEEKKKYRVLTLNRLSLAASLFLMMALGVVFWQVRYGEREYTTGYGQTATVVLPDGSVVTLNGNSRLSVPKRWPTEGDREVQVEGEAYFSIQHTTTHQKFFVRMEGSASVEVLGTEFNVSNRNAETEVVLSSGKIALHLPSVKGAEEQVVEMKPGDLVLYRKSDRYYNKKAVNPEHYSSWKSSKLLFEDTQLKEVLDILKDTYGMKIIVDDPAILKRMISGSAPTKNVDLLIGGLSEILDLTFTKNGNTLMITSK